MIIERWSIIAADMNERMSEAERVIKSANIKDLRFDES